MTLEAVGEIDIRCSYLGSGECVDPKYRDAAATNRLPAGKVLAEISEAWSRGVRALLLSLETPGGHVGESWHIYDTLQMFSRHRGPVVVHVLGWCASTATFIALAGDYVVMDPAAQLVVHSMVGRNRASVEADNRRALEVYASRTLTPRAELERWLSLQDGQEFDRAVLEGPAALYYGWADRIGGRDVALA